MDAGTRLGATASLAMMCWLTLVLLLDAEGSHPLQRVLGGLTWVVLLAALRRASMLLRAQTVVVVGVATVVELVFAQGLEVYTYRFDNVPMYVPPGHGLVYLSAFALGHNPFVRRHLRACTVVLLGGLGAWAAHGLLLAERSDQLGAFWFLCLVGFLRWGPSREVYVGAGVVVTWLELAGTHLGTWVWGTEDFAGLMTIGNPPSGAAGGYGWFDLAGLLAAPYLLALGGGLSRPRGRRPAQGPAPRADRSQPPPTERAVAER